MATAMPNPHYLPEVASHVTLLNFSITKEGLEQQLLSVLVAIERSDLEEARDNLKAEGAAMARELQQLEERVRGLPWLGTPGTPSLTPSDPTPHRR